MFEIFGLQTWQTLWIASGLVAALAMMADIFFNLDADDRKGFNLGDLVAFTILSVFFGPITLALAILLTLFNARYWVGMASRRAQKRRDRSG